MIVIGDRKKTCPFQEIVLVCALVLVICLKLSAKVFHLHFKEASGLLCVNEGLSVIALFVLDSAQIQLVQGVLVGNLFEVMLCFVNLTRFLQRAPQVI